MPSLTGVLHHSLFCWRSLTAGRQPVKVKINCNDYDRKSFGYWTVIGFPLNIYRIVKKKSTTRLYVGYHINKEMVEMKE